MGLWVLQAMPAVDVIAAIISSGALLDYSFNAVVIAPMMAASLI